MDTCCFSFYVDSRALNDIADQNKNQKQTKNHQPSFVHFCLFVVVSFQSW